jgi:hypothetical protein
LPRQPELGQSLKQGHDSFARVMPFLLLSRIGNVIILEVRRHLTEAMITCQKLRDYLEFKNEITKPTMSTADWNLINELLQGLHLTAKELVSEEYKQQIERKFLESTADEETREMLRKMPNKFTRFQV